MDKQPDQTEKAFETVSNAICEIFLKRQDFYKTLLTLNTTTLLILIAFSDRIINPPLPLKLVLIPFMGFALSLIFSLVILKSFGDLHDCLKDYQAKVTAMVAAGQKDASGLLSIKKNMADLGKNVSRFQGLALYAYLFGMLSLVIFAALSLFLAK